MKNVHKRRRFEPHRWRTKVEARATRTPPVNVIHMCLSLGADGGVILTFPPLFHIIKYLSSFCFHTLFLSSLLFLWTTTQRKETKTTKSDCEKERRRRRVRRAEVTLIYSLLDKLQLGVKGQQAGKTFRDRFSELAQVWIHVASALTHLFQYF